MARVTTVEVVALAPEGGGGGFTRGLRWKGAAGKRKSVRTAALAKSSFRSPDAFVATVVDSPEPRMNSSNSSSSENAHSQDQLRI